MSKVKKAMITAVCTALCVVLAMAFRALPGGGAIYGPLILPVLLCALVCGAGRGSLCAMLGVTLSAVINGSPTAALFVPVMCECVCCGASAGLVAGRATFGERATYAAVPTGLIVGRIAGGVVEAVLFAPDMPALAVWATGYFAASLPGLIVMLVLVPALVRALAVSSVIPTANPAKEQTNGD